MMLPVIDWSDLDMHATYDKFRPLDTQMSLLMRVELAWCYVPLVNIACTMCAGEYWCLWVNTHTPQLMPIGLGCFWLSLVNVVSFMWTWISWCHLVDALRPRVKSLVYVQMTWLICACLGLHYMLLATCLKDLNIPFLWMQSLDDGTCNCPTSLARYVHST